MLDDSYIYENLFQKLSNEKDPDVQNGWITKNKTKDGLSVSFFKKLTCHIWYSKKNNVFYIAILKEYEDYFIDANLPRMADVALWFRFPITNKNDLETLFPYFRKLYDHLAENYSVSGMFGCCSHYLECSDNKACISKDKVFSSRCQYNKLNLSNGKIFYGKNRNM